jgi:Transposase DDE domain
LTSLNDWLDKHNLATEEPLKPYIEALSQVRKQDLEVSQGRVHLRRGVAEDRRVSIEDPDMRHGRKSKSKRFNGYKQHVAADLETELILACAVTPANRPEEEATPALQADLKARDVRIGSLSIDRAYVNSQLVREVIKSGGTVLAKPWSGRNSRAPELFGKRDFKIDMRAKTITCPAGQMEPFEPGAVVEFDPEICGPCVLRSLCTLSASGGRSVHTSAQAPGDAPRS